MIGNSDKFIPYIDVLSEPSINMIRIYLIIRELQFNRNNRLVLTLEKLCFFNATIVSNEIVNSILVINNKLKENEYVNFEDESLSYKHNGDIREAIQGGRVNDYVIQMCCLGIIEISIINKEKIISIMKDIDINDNDPLIKKWKKNISKLKFCISQSEKELYSSLLEAFYE
jgi:hypothetical protein